MVRVNGSATDITPVNGDYTITVTGIQTYAGLPGGCGQVAIYGADQTTVIWSFIIWMTPTPAEHPYGNTGYVVLDRNLGTYMTCEGDNWSKTVFTSNGDVLRRSAGREPWVLIYLPKPPTSASL